MRLDEMGGTERQSRDRQRSKFELVGSRIGSHRPRLILFRFDKLIVCKLTCQGAGQNSVLWRLFLVSSSHQLRNSSDNTVVLT
jgi:hypothetical protein